jgi:hypothetical protein
LTVKVGKIADLETMGEEPRKNYGSAGGFWQLPDGSNPSEIAPELYIGCWIFKQKVLS